MLWADFQPTGYFRHLSQAGRGLVARDCAVRRLAPANWPWCGPARIAPLGSRPSLRRPRIIACSAPQDTLARRAPSENSPLRLTPSSLAPKPRPTRWYPAPDHITNRRLQRQRAHAMGRRTGLSSRCFPSILAPLPLLQAARDSPLPPRLLMISSEKLET